MALNIKSNHAHRLAEQLARLRGISLTQAVTEALQAELDREKRKQDPAALAARLVEIGKVCAAHIREPLSSADHGDLLYDDAGLPR